MDALTPARILPAPSPVWTFWLYVSSSASALFTGCRFCCFVMSAPACACILCASAFRSASTCHHGFVGPPVDLADLVQSLHARSHIPARVVQDRLRPVDLLVRERSIVHLLLVGRQARHILCQPLLRRRRQLAGVNRDPHPPTSRHRDRDSRHVREPLKRMLRCHLRLRGDPLRRLLSSQQLHLTRVSWMIWFDGLRRS